MSVKLYLQTALQIGNDVKLFTFNKMKLKKQSKRLSVWFLKVSFKKYLLNNLLMLLHFSNVERHRFFSFFVYVPSFFFYPKNGGRTFFLTRPHCLWTSTAFSFSGIRRVDKLLTERTFFVLFSQDTSSLFFAIVQNNCKAIQFWLNQDSPATCW